MTCGCGRSYIINEDDGYPTARRKKDNSFKLFITFLLIVLLVLIVIYCIFLAFNRQREKDTSHAYFSKESINGKIENPITTPSWLVESNTTKNNHFSSTSNYGNQNPQSSEMGKINETTESNEIPLVSNEDQYSTMSTSQNRLNMFNDTAETTLRQDSNFLSTQVSNENFVTEVVNKQETTTEIAHTDGSLVEKSFEHVDVTTTDYPVVTNNADVEDSTLINLFKSTSAYVAPNFEKEETRTSNIMSTTIPSEKITKNVIGMTTNDELIKVDYVITTSQTITNMKKGSDIPEKSIKNEKLCNSAACRKKAGRILHQLDYAIDPCDDFYQFSCGDGGNKFDKSDYVDVLLKVLFTSEIKGDKYFKTFRQFFESCINYEHEVGYSTKINQVFSSNVRDNNLTSLLAFLFLRQSTPLFEVRYGLVGGKEGYGLQMLPPDANYERAGVKDWSLQSQIKKHCLTGSPSLKYQNAIHLPTVYEDYQKCKKETFKKMPENFVAEKIERSNVTKKTILGDFIGFFSKLNTVSSFNLQNALLYQKYTKTTVHSLKQKYPQIDWIDFFNKITDEKFDSNAVLYLYLEQEYFQPMMSDLKDRMLKTEKDVIETLKLYYQVELYQNLLANKKDKDVFCVNQAANFMPEIATKLFYENSGLKDSSYKFIRKIFNDLLDSFYWIIETSHLEEANKKVFKEGLVGMELRFFEDNQQWNETLEDIYGYYYLTKDYLSNVFMFIEYKRQRQGKNYLLHDQIQKFVETQGLSAPVYIPYSHTIAIPLAFLYNIKTYQAEYPPYIIESLLRFYLSRALALRMDNLDKGVKSAFYRMFMQSLNNYLENGDDIKVLKGQQIMYKPDVLIWQPIIQLSDTTRMADNIGLEIAFRDMHFQNETIEKLPFIPQELSPQHQFFIIISQEYCENPSVPRLAQQLYEELDIPSTFRFDNMIMNSEYFSNTFQCPTGTKMNPEEKTQFDSFIPSDGLYYFEDDQINK